MVEMTLSEAQLYRMLGAFFGRDRVVWNMSVRTVCGGTYPEMTGQSSEEVANWAEAAACLFTIVDDDDEPKMVIELAPDYSRFIDVGRLERHQLLPALLESCGIEYLALSPTEFDEILDPRSSLDLISVLKDKFGIVDELEEADGSQEDE